MKVSKHSILLLHTLVGEVVTAKRWFHVSDTSVTEVSEEKVLKAQVRVANF